MGVAKQLFASQNIQHFFQLSTFLFTGSSHHHSGSATNQYHSGMKQHQHEVKVLGDKNGSPPSYNKTIGSLFYTSTSASVASKASQQSETSSLAPQYMSASSLPQPKSLIGAVSAHNLFPKKQIGIGLPKPTFSSPSRLPQNRVKK